MPAGGFSASSASPHAMEFEAKITPIVVFSCVMAATGGLMFGYDIGISGTSSNPILPVCGGLQAAMLLVHHQSSIPVVLFFLSSELPTGATHRDRQRQFCRIEKKVLWNVKRCQNTCEECQCEQRTSLSTRRKFRSLFWTSKFTSKWARERRPFFGNWNSLCNTQIGPVQFGGLE